MDWRDEIIDYYRSEAIRGWTFYQAAMLERRLAQLARGDSKEVIYDKRKVTKLIMAVGRKLERDMATSQTQFEDNVRRLRNGELVDDLPAIDPSLPIHQVQLFIEERMEKKSLSKLKGAQKEKKAKKQRNERVIPDNWEDEVSSKDETAKAPSTEDKTFRCPYCSGRPTIDRADNSLQLAAVETAASTVKSVSEKTYTDGTTQTLSQEKLRAKSADFSSRGENSRLPGRVRISTASGMPVEIKHQGSQTTQFKQMTGNKQTQTNGGLQTACKQMERATQTEREQKKKATQTEREQKKKATQTEREQIKKATQTEREQMDKETQDTTKQVDVATQIDQQSVNRAVPQHKPRFSADSDTSPFSERSLNAASNYSMQLSAMPPSSSIPSAASMTPLASLYQQAAPKLHQYASHVVHPISNYSHLQYGAFAAPRLQSNLAYPQANFVPQQLPTQTNTNPPPLQKHPPGPSTPKTVSKNELEFLLGQPASGNKVPHSSVERQLPEIPSTSTKPSTADMKATSDTETFCARPKTSSASKKTTTKPAVTFSDHMTPKTGLLDIKFGDTETGAAVDKTAHSLAPQSSPPAVSKTWASLLRTRPPPDEKSKTAGKMSSKKPNQEELERVECMICLEEFPQAEKCKLACGHDELCRKCIGRWAMKNPTCPKCRRDMK